MGHLGLRDLDSVGVAAARFVNWINDPASRAGLDALETCVDALVAGGGETRQVGEPIPFSLGWGSWSSRDDWTIHNLAPI